VLAIDVHLIDMVTSLDHTRQARILARRMLGAADWPRMAGELMH
jgi:hypothetical protein